MNKTMKKVFLFALITLSFVFVSCGDDNDELGSSHELVGEWVHYSSASSAHYYIFDADHSGSYWNTFNGKIYDEDHFKWSVKGNFIILDREGHIDQMEFSINDDILHVMDGGPDGMDYQRVR